MKIIEEHIDGGMFDSAIFSEYFSGMRIAVADIETTGLSPKNSAVILGGVVLADGESRRAVQLFGDTADDEPELLARYAEILEENDVVITYNGDRFDLPFLRGRMERCGLDASVLDRLFSVDMYRILKDHSYLPGLLPNMKQKTVEAFLGDASERTDGIDGAESVKLYYEYCRSKGERRQQLLDFILLHNRDDIVRLSDMLRIVKTLDLHEIMYSTSFPVCFAESNIHIKNIMLTQKKLAAKGLLTGMPTDYQCFGSGYRISVSAEARSAYVETECQKEGDSIVADVAALGVDWPVLRELGGYESGYLILKEGENVRYQEINRLIRILLQSALQ